MCHECNWLPEEDKKPKKKKKELIEDADPISEDPEEKLLEAWKEYNDMIDTLGI